MQRFAPTSKPCLGGAIPWPPFDCIALLLQGGGSLGAYQGGVNEALVEADLQRTANSAASAWGIIGAPGTTTPHARCSTKRSSSGRARKRASVHSTSRMTVPHANA